MPNCAGQAVRVRGFPGTTIGENSRSTCFVAGVSVQSVIKSAPALGSILANRWGTRLNEEAGKERRPNVMPDGEPRTIPPLTYRKWRIWRNASMGWKTAHYLAGFLSTVLATIIAINTKTAFLNSTSALAIASLAAGLAFLVTTMGAQERVRLLERAAWELEAAMAIYRNDGSVPLSELGKAEARGIDILKGGKP